jgi:hypothetical protein
LEFLPSIPRWAWLLVAGLALFPRCYQLTTLLRWPHFDEGLYGFYALRILHHGLDRFLYCGVPVSPFYPCWLAACFKVLGPSLLSLWASPLPFSLAVIPLSYWAGRRWGFSRSFCALCALLAAIGFWFWFIGRFAMQVTLIPAAELLVLGLLAGPWKAPPPRRLLAAALLGFCVGTVFYGIYFHWVVVAALVALTLGWTFRRSPHLLAAFGVTAALTCLPLWVGGLGQSGSPYLHQLWSLSERSFSWLKVENSLSYISALFWGVPLRYYTFQPVWGGFLNPILGSLWMLGSVEAAFDRDPRGRWLAAASLFLWLPGLLTSDCEPFRIAPLAALTLPLIALGMIRLFQGPWSRKAAVTAGLLLAASFSLDLYHLAGPLHRIWDDPEYCSHYVKAIDHERAYQILRDRAKTFGPGVILANFPTGVEDQTLGVAAYSFDAALNPALDPEAARWLAVEANVNDQPFLRKTWGEGRSYALTKDLRAPDGGLMLWVVPLDGTNRPRMRLWLRADLDLEDFTEAYYGICNLKVPEPFFEVRPSLTAHQEDFGKDPLLASFFWLKMADLAIKAGRLDQAVEDMGQALGRGVPAAHLYYRRGTLETALERRQEAQRDFFLATRAPLDLTESRDLLDPSALRSPSRGLK